MREAASEAPPPPMDPAERGKTTDPRRMGTGRRRKRRALIAAGDPVPRDARAWCLRAGGWQVVEVATGEEALLMAAAFLPDALIVDLDLPGMGGAEVAQRVKEDPATKDVAVVCCVAREPDAPGGREASVSKVAWDAFVATPCNAEDIRSLLETIVDPWTFDS